MASALRISHRSSRRVGALLTALMLGNIVAAGPARAVDTVPGTQMSVSDWNRQMRQRIFGVKMPSGYISRTSGPTSSTAAKRVLAAKRTQTGPGGPLKVTHLMGDAQSASKFGRAAKTAGALALGPVAFDLSYRGTGWVMTNMFDIPSNGPVCDFTELIGVGCSLTASPDYIPNSDVVLSEPGWFPSNTFAFTGYQASGSSSYYSVGTYSVSVLPVPYGSTGAQDYTITQSVDGLCTEKGTNAFVEWPALSFEVIYVNANGTVASQSLRSFANSMTGRCTGSASTITLTDTKTVPNGFTFDRIQARMGARGDYWATETSPGYMTPGVLPTWYPDGHQDRPADVDSDPQRQWVTDYLCSVGGPGVITSEPWHESSAEWPAPPMPECDSGSLTKVKIVQRSPGMEDYVLIDWTASTALDDFAQEFGDCLDGSCILELHRVDELTGRSLACFDNPALCLGWFEMPDKQDLFKCTYGKTAVPLDDCNVYGPTFDPDLRTATDVPLGDPDTGIRPTPDPTDPPVVVDPDTPPMDTSCPPPFTWTSVFNPWYYYKGTVCALSWAFVPRSLDANVSNLRNTWDQSSVGQILKAVGSLGAAFVMPPAGSCGVLYNHEISSLGGQSLTLDTCASPWPNFASVRDVSGFAMLGGAVILALRMASRLLRVDPVGTSTGES